LRERGGAVGKKAIEKTKTPRWGGVGSEPWKRGARAARWHTAGGTGVTARGRGGNLCWRGGMPETNVWAQEWYGGQFVIVGKKKSGN